uniref:YlBUD6 n=1 Tax=Coccidioides posadasii RMSCC 3488 TaxID=454284 RepID=A0A0J6FCW2_COCPO|nr:YlBUD6 [Coccidioides posadasii RMSCC 3488]
MQNMPVLQPYDQDSVTARPQSPASQNQIHGFPHPPPPPPKANDAIGMLQRSGELERRASRRFSAYQIQKHLGPTNGLPVLPSSQSSQLNSRGRDVLRLRGPAHGRKQSGHRRVGDSTRPPTTPEPSVIAKIEPPPEPVPEDSPTAKTPTDKVRPSRDIEHRDTPIVDKPVPSLPQIPERDSLQEGVDKASKQETDHGETRTVSMDSQNSRPAQFTPDMSPPPSSKEVTLFLQYKTKIKKYVLAEGYAGLTIGRLQLAFIEKFAWNTHNNGVDLPEIYIQDPISGVRHELEDLNDVKDRSVLVLNVEALDEVKKHIDESVGGVRRLIEGVRDTMDNQAASIQLLTDRQQQAAKEIARLAAGPAPLSSANGQSLASNAKGSYVTEIQSLRRDLAVLRQTYSNFSSDVSASMNNVRTKANAVKTVATDMSVPSYEGDAGRARVNAGKKELADESEKLVARVDDLQDLVEDLRKDVVTRGVRPLPRQLEAVGRDISAVTKELKKMQDFLKREKPIWTKIWEKELQQVCEERDQLTMQEDLAVDLEDDLEKATQTFALVEQATKQQAFSRRILTATPQLLAKDSVLGEVRALQPNHENRVEAIERAEKARQKELESRRIGQFQKELGAFVEGGKLKKSGGFEEAERLRKAKDEKIRKEVWERMQGLNTGDTEEEQPAPQSPKEESPLENGEPDTSALKQDEEPENAADVRNEVDAPAAPSSPPANTTTESPKSASGGNRSSSGPASCVRAFAAMPLFTHFSIYLMCRISL